MKLSFLIYNKKKLYIKYTDYQENCQSSPPYYLIVTKNFLNFLNSFLAISVFRWPVSTLWKTFGYKNRDHPCCQYFSFGHPYTYMVSLMQNIIGCWTNDTLYSIGFIYLCPKLSQPHNLSIIFIVQHMATTRTVKNADSCLFVIRL